MNDRAAPRAASTRWPHNEENNLNRLVVVAGILLSLTGCSIAANPYAISPDNVVALRAHKATPVQVAPFTSDKPGKSEIMCRAVGMIQTPNAVPFETYVRDAFRAEMLVAGLEAPDAPVTLTGHLERMHFDTGDAIWELRLVLKSSNGRQLALSEDYKFNWHFMGDHACREVATSMPLAVQALVRRAVTHQDFAGLLRPAQ